jgi:hypothetical protein
VLDLQYDAMAQQERGEEEEEESRGSGSACDDGCEDE